MNAYRTTKESLRIYQSGRKEQIRERNSGKRLEAGSAGKNGKKDSLYGELLREFMGTQVECRGMKLFSVENLT